LNKKINLKFKQNKEALKKQQTQNINLESYRCPQCNHIVELDNKPIQNTVLQCPICGQQNILKVPREKSEKKYEESNLNYWISRLNKNAVIVGMIFIFISMFSLFISNPFGIKMNITLLIIGTIISLFVLREQQVISLKITFGIIIFIILLYFMTGTDLEIFLIFIFLGVLITKIILNEYLPTSLKISMNIFILAFFIIFIIIVIKRIINIVSM
jgi:DNA-directed RNA polymerase subunit RPC12/RpoP